MKINFLGTSCALASAQRDHTSLLVETSSLLILVDVSGNSPGKMLQLEYDPNDLDLVLLTHLHIDHCYGLPALLFHMFLAGRTRNLHLVVSREESEELEQQLSHYGVYPDVRTYSITLHRVTPPDEFILPENPDIVIQTAAGIHSRFNVAYRIKDTETGLSCTYSGDSRPCAPIRNLARNTHLLIHEATYLERNRHYAEEYGHSTAGEAAQVAADAETGALALVHLDTTQSAEIDDFRAEALSFYKRKIFIPDDMDILKITKSGGVLHERNPH